MILVIGSDEDPTTTYFVDFLYEQQVNHLFLNQKYFLQGIEISNKVLDFFGQKYTLSTFSGVLNRLTSVECKELVSMPKKYYRCLDALDNIIDNFLPNVLNPGYLGYSNDSKLFQSILIKTNNIKIPQSFVLAGVKIGENLSKISQFNDHIVKSLSAIRSIVQHFENNLGLFPDQSKEPVLFQELINGINIRVHVIDNTCVAVKVFSDSLDYRYGKNKTIGEEYTLPPKIQDDCVLIAKQLQLRFCGIDLIMKNDTYYFLEANPAPGWSYFEEMINNKIISYQLVKTLSQQ